MSCAKSKKWRLISPFIHPVLSANKMFWVQKNSDKQFPSPIRYYISEFVFRSPTIGFAFLSPIFPSQQNVLSRKQIATNNFLHIFVFTFLSSPFVHWRLAPPFLHLFFPPNKTLSIKIATNNLLHLFVFTFLQSIFSHRRFISPFCHPCSPPN